MLYLCIGNKGNEALIENLEIMETFATIQEALASFKILFVEKSVEYAKGEFAKWMGYFEGDKGWNTARHNYVADNHTHLIDPACTELFDFYNSRIADTHTDYELRKKIENAVTAIDRIVRKHTIESYTELKRAEAESDFEESLLKLMARIAAKNINLESATILSAHVQQNLNISITDGKKTVNAYTVLAWGDVQRPHYRYIVK